MTDGPVDKQLQTFGRRRRSLGKLPGTDCELGLALSDLVDNGGSRLTLFAMSADNGSPSADFAGPSLVNGVSFPVYIPAHSASPNFLHVYRKRSESPHAPPPPPPRASDRHLSSTSPSSFLTARIGGTLLQIALLLQLGEQPTRLRPVKHAHNVVHVGRCAFPTSGAHTEWPRRYTSASSRTARAIASALTSSRGRPPARAPRTPRVVRCGVVAIATP